MSDSPQEGASSEQEADMNQTYETLPTRMVANLQLPQGHSFTGDPDVFAAALVAMETRMMTIIRSEQHVAKGSPAEF